ncbi:exported hypothetical protein [Verrucomicrobia bacterium]|nr:exported hypothetical protein [Verrucomicrobiota bacterium]
MKNSDESHRTNRGITRRDFLAASGAASAFMVFPSRVLGRDGQTSPNNKLNLAGIGVGGQGGEDLNEMTSENVVALCDVDWDHAAHTFKKFPNAKVYKDFRQMLDTEKSIDAVVVGTPDHNHAIVSMAAIQHAKHVYCEKPLTHTVREARLLAQAAKQAKVATQMGNQGMAFEGNRLINEWLWDGAIGPVRAVHAWSDRPTHKGRLPLWWAQGVERPTDTPSVPATLDWDLWLCCGLAPHPLAPITPPTPPSVGAVGGISAPAASATWAFTTWPPSSPPSNWEPPVSSRPAPHRFIRTASPLPRSCNTTSRLAATCPP